MPRTFKMAPADADPDGKLVQRYKRLQELRDDEKLKDRGIPRLELALTVYNLRYLLRLLAAFHRGRPPPVKSRKHAGPPAPRY
jgi:hypothetical protein